MGLQRAFAIIAVFVAAVFVFLGNWDGGIFWLCLAIINQLWAMDSDR